MYFRKVVTVRAGNFRLLVNFHALRDTEEKLYQKRNENLALCFIFCFYFRFKESLSPKSAASFLSRQSRHYFTLNLYTYEALAVILYRLNSINLWFASRKSLKISGVRSERKIEN